MPTPYVRYDYGNEHIDTRGVLPNLHARTMAQDRRRQENDEFRKLSQLLPVARAISEKHLDKATVVRLAGTYIRLNNTMGMFRATLRDPVFTCDTNIIEMLEGFLLCLSFNGDVLYVSETVSLHLGLSQVDMCGNSFASYLHREDAPQFRLALNNVQNNMQQEYQLNLRIRSTLTKRKNKESPLCAAGFKVISIDVYCRLSTAVLCFCQPHNVKITNGMRLPSDAIIVNTDDKFHVRYADHPDKTVFTIRCGMSFYDVVHPMDLYLVIDLHHQLHKLGSYTSPIVRLISKEGVFYAEISAIKCNNGNRLPNVEESESRTTLVISVIGF